MLLVFSNYLACGLRYLCRHKMPPKKRAKKILAATKKSTSSSSEDESPTTSSTPAKNKIQEESFEQFMNRIKCQRVDAAKQFKFDKSRCRILSKEETMSGDHQGILYWMSRDQRVEDNYALIYAQRKACQEKVPLFVCFCLVPKFLDATLRQYAFLLKGLQLVRAELHELKIPFHLLFGDPKIAVPQFVKEHGIGGVITDFAPLRVPMQWANSVAKELLKERVPLCQIDAHNIVPIWQASDKQEYAARTIRSKIDKQLGRYLTEFPPVIEHSYNSKLDFSQIPNPFEDWDALISSLEIDKTVQEVTWAKPGMVEGFKMLKLFLDTRLKIFHSKRNDPNEAALSNLSPWFHFGQISVARAILEAKKSSFKDGVAVFCEEAIIRRELSDNFCYYNNDNYDSLEGASDWAKTTLNNHRKDKRSYLYSKEELENAKTHDPLWNAAQIQLRVEGKMHGFLRMYWAKKILEWTKDPEQALEIAIFLNDKYNLDGRDPNGYVGCMWSICGVHDQGWAEREVFGKIRYMNYEGCKRKFDVKKFENKYRKIGQKEQWN